MVIKLAQMVYWNWRVNNETMTSGDVFWKALKQLLPLAAFPALLLLFIILVFIYNIYYSLVTPIPGDCIRIYCYVEFNICSDCNSSHFCGLTACMHEMS